MGNLMNYERPYVHSNAEYFRDHMDGMTLDSKSPEGKAALEATIANLRAISAQLKAHTDLLLGGESPQAFSKKLFNNDKTFSGVVLQILNEPAMDKVYRKIADIWDEKEAEKLLEILRDRTVKEITEKDVRGALHAKIDANRKTTNMPGLQVHSIELADIARQMGKEFTLDYQKKGRRVATTAHNVFKEDANEFFHSVGVKKSLATEQQIDQIMKYVKSEFMKRCQHIPQLDTYTTEIFFARMEAKLLDDFHEGLLSRITSASSFSATLGEAFVVAVHYADTSHGFKMKWVGSVSEEQVRKDIAGTKEKADATARNYKDPQKQSYRDILILKDGNTWSVQSKNYRAITRKILEGNFDGGAMFASLQGSILYKRLISRLQELGLNTFPQTTLESLSYYIANLLWFSIAGSMDSSGEAKRYMRKGRVKGGYKLMEGVQDQINQMLSAALLDFLGVTMGRAGDQMAAQMSNSFYLINNRDLVPTYLIIDDVITWLETAQRQIFSLHATLSRSSKGWPYSTPKSHMNRKMALLHDSRFRKYGGYVDFGLVEAGQSLGAVIIDNLEVTNINLYIDINSLTSGW